MSRSFIASSLLTGAAVVASSAAIAQTPSNQELYDIVAAQQARIEALEAKKGDSGGGLFSDKVSIGGYGELHYNNLSGEGDAGDKKEIDFHRFVLFFGYEFNDGLRFVSEFELEHALAGDGDDKPGEVELEQAYIEYDVNNKLSVRGGVFLIPVGILNETHEPPTFYGVERNNVESVIVPSTWWAGGAGFSLKLPAGLSFDLALHEGLAIPVDGSNAFRVRSGRQKTAEANASNLAATTRLKYTGVPGLEVGLTFQYQDDASQEKNDGLDEGLLTETHLVYNKGMFGLRALYAHWKFEGDAVEEAGADSQKGWYIEPSLKFNSNWGVFTRFEDVDGARSRDEFEEVVAGVNYWPHSKVVIKADYRVRDHDNEEDEDRDFRGFDLGIGYQF